MTGSSSCHMVLSAEDIDRDLHSVLQGLQQAVDSQCAIPTVLAALPDPEILERRYPVVLRQFSLRKGSGGAGRHNGGDGVIREVCLLAVAFAAEATQVTVLDTCGHLQLQQALQCLQGLLVWSFYS